MAQKLVKLKIPDPPTLDWTKTALKGLVLVEPGMTVFLLVQRFREVYGFQLPLFDFSSYRSMIKSFTDIFMFDGERIHSIPRTRVFQKPKFDGARMCSNPRTRVFQKPREEQVSKDWFRIALKDILSSNPQGLTLTDLKNQFVDLFEVPLPRFQFSSYWEMLRSFRDIILWDGHLFYEASRVSERSEPEVSQTDASEIVVFESETKVQEPTISMDDIKILLNEIASSMPGGSTVLEILSKFEELFEIKLPRFNFATERLMLESMQDVLVFDGDIIYAVGDVAASHPVANTSASNPPDPNPEETELLKHIEHHTEDLK